MERTPRSPVYFRTCITTLTMFVVLLPVRVLPTNNTFDMCVEEVSESFSET